MLATLTVSALVFFVFLIGSIIYKYNSHGKRPTTIPGPDVVDRKNGNLSAIKRAGGLHDFLTQLHRKYGDIVSFWMESQMVVSIASSELFKENMGVFDRPAFLFEFIEPLFGKASIQYANGTDGKRRRALYDKSFSHSACKTYQDEFQKISEELIDKWAKTPRGEHIPLHQHMMAVALKAITRTCFGNFFNEDQTIYEFMESYEKAMNAMNDLISDPIYEKNEKGKPHFQVIYEFTSLVKKILKFREENGPETEEKRNFLDILMDTTTDQDIMVSDVITYTVGGFHTTGNYITWAVYFIARHQDIQEKIYQEMKKVLGDKPLTMEKVKDLVYTQQVLDETLRAAAITPFAARVLETDSTLGGHVIPANTPIVHALGVILLDEKYWPEPNKFDPERFSEEAIKKIPKLSFEPFGFAGKRKCPGYRFSYTETRVVLCSLIHTFVIRLVNDEPAVPIYGFVTKPKDEIWITVEKRDVTSC